MELPCIISPFITGLRFNFFDWFICIGWHVRLLNGHRRIIAGYRFKIMQTSSSNIESPYESARMLGEYLSFHYGSAVEILPYENGPRGALEFHGRCVEACLEGWKLPGDACALDMGCSVGRASFELARSCGRVVGIDYSTRFIDAANQLKETGALGYGRLEEGARFTECVARIPADIDRSRVHFETGDAMELRVDLGRFDIVLAANLLCRLRTPSKFLARLPLLVKPGGRLVLTTPCTWMEEFTPRENWLCSEMTGTLDGLHRHIDPHFKLVSSFDLPFLIREHARKYQWTIALASVWTASCVC